MPVNSRFIRISGMSHYVQLHEFRGGLSSSTIYYFIVDGSLLKHISEYAIQRKDMGNLIEYQIDLDRIRGKLIIEIPVSNSGILCSAWIYRAEELLTDFPEREVLREPLSYLNTLNFSYLEPHERMFLESEWKKYYTPMLLDLRSFVNELKKLGISVIMSNLLQCQIVSGANYPLSYLIPYSSKAREKSLEALTKFIHQAWVTMKLVDELRRRANVYILSPEFMVFGQSSYTPAIVYQVHNNVYSIWWEFDLTPHTMCRGILWSRDIPPTLREYYERAGYYYQKHGSAPLRPDIVVLKNAQSCSDIIERGLNILAVFECKNLDYAEWANKIETQIKPYAEIFNPVYIFLISMKPVPRHINEHLKKYGVIVVDNAYPGGKGEQNLIKVVEYLLT